MAGFASVVALGVILGRGWIWWVSDCVMMDRGSIIVGVMVVEVFAGVGAEVRVALLGVWCIVMLALLRRQVIVYGGVMVGLILYDRVSSCVVYGFWWECELLVVLEFFASGEVHTIWLCGP